MTESANNQIEAERDKARTWAAMWKRAAKGWKKRADINYARAKGWMERAGLNDDRAEVWREKAMKAEQGMATLAKRVAELEMEGARDNKALKSVEAERDRLKVDYQEPVHRWDGLAGYNPLMTPADNWNQLRAKIDQLKTLPALLQTCEAQLAEELRRRAELEQELELNASMLARQCDLAREAESDRDEAKLLRELEALRKVKTAARSLVKNLPPGEIEIGREAWGNTNTRIVSEVRMALAEALDELQ